MVAFAVEPVGRAIESPRAFAKRGGPVMLEVEAFNTDPLPLLALVKPPTPLKAMLVGHGVTASIAAELVWQHGGGGDEFPMSRIGSAVAVGLEVGEERPQGSQLAADSTAGLSCG